MINPVFKRELKSKGRSLRTPLMIIIYLLVISSVMAVILYATNESYNSNFGFDPQYIKSIYLVITLLMMGLICFIVPATTSGSICGEKQRKTFDLMVCTKMSSWSIVLGKLASSLLQTVMLLIATIPILSILFLYGGLSIWNIILLFLFFLVVAVLLGSIGLFCSSYFKRTVTATVVSYIVMLVLTLGTIYVVGVAVGVFNTYLSAGTIRNIARLIYINPFTGLSAILSQQMGENVFIGYIANISLAKRAIVYNISFNIIASVVLLFCTTLRINPIKRYEIFK